MEQKQRVTINQLLLAGKTLGHLSNDELIAMIEDTETDASLLALLVAERNRRLIFGS